MKLSKIFTDIIPLIEEFFFTHYLFFRLKGYGPNYMERGDKNVCRTNFIGFAFRYIFPHFAVAGC